MLNDTYAKIGQRVKKYRKERGLSQDELADEICSRQTISLLENGQHFPASEIIQKLAVRLSVPIHEIMVDEGKELDVKTQLNLIMIYIETFDYQHATHLIEELETREDVLEYQKRHLIVNRAECLMRTGNADQAIHILTDLQQRLEQQRDSDDHFLATVYDKLGTANHFLSNLANAYANYSRAYQLTLLFPQFNLTAAQITYNLGMACRLLNRPKEAISLLSEAEAFFRNASDVKRLAQSLFELGIAYRYGRNLERANSCLQESLALYRSINIFNMANLVKESYAFSVMSNHNMEEAVEELLKCAKCFEMDGNLMNVAFTYARISYILLQKKNVESAIDFIEQALELFNEEKDLNNPRYAYVFRVKSMCLLEGRNFTGCVDFANKSFEIFDKMGFDSEAAESLKCSAEAFRKQGMYEHAYQVSEKIIDILSRSQNSISKMEAFF